MNTPPMSSSKGEAYPQFLNFKTRMQPRNRWTDPQREICCVLRHFYDNTWPELTKIFNLLFQRHLQRHGFSDSLRSTIFATQAHDLKLKQHPIWIRVVSTPPNDLGPYGSMLRHIEMAAQKLGLDLKRRVEGTFELPDFDISDLEDADLDISEEILAEALEEHNDGGDDNNGSGSNNEEDEDEDDNANDNDDNDDRDDDIQEIRRNLPIHTPPLRQAPNKHRQVPRPKIAFRFYDDQSAGINSKLQFVAGMFAEGPTYFPHPHQSDSRMITSMARSHLSRFEIESPFISCSSSPLVAIHRMLRSNQSAFFSIIDLSKLNPDMVFSAQEILMKRPLSKKITRRYTGVSDFMIWGQIPDSCIITAISAADILNMTYHHPDIASLLQLDVIQSFPYSRRDMHNRMARTAIWADQSAGKVFGKLFQLLNIPESYAQELATIFTRAWRLRCLQRGSFTGLMDGLRSYFNTYRLEEQQRASEAEGYVSPPITPTKESKERDGGEPDGNKTAAAETDMIQNTVNGCDMEIKVEPIDEDDDLMEISKADYMVATEARLRNSEPNDDVKEIPNAGLPEVDRIDIVPNSSRADDDDYEKTTDRIEPSDRFTIERERINRVLGL
ncbi:hypothetical protein AJ80_00365 [Polytolypa hystricis UAMH7299]|uniref:DUF7587 domain-containing protein n=1 Tax=Polytolypa hystricis (strain UAMH7299) TaxID=1447883 RepID=A0A2B7Z5H9_POLH7|nr:hypothetical protein AJ80_00365 [Polytolypa hystricis UAMH7299]